MPEDEAGFIALHFVNAEYGTDIRDAVKFPDQMQAIVDIVERDLGILLDESSLHYERFMTHIYFVLQVCRVVISPDLVRWLVFSL